MRSGRARATVVRMMSIVAVVLVVAVVLYWRSQVTSSSANAAAGVVVSAGAPPGADIPQVTATGLSLGPAQALSAELPSLEPAAVPLVQKAPAMVPEHESPRDSRAVVETDSGTTAVWSNDEIGPADVESAGEETKEPPPEPQQPTLGQMYTWEDGDRTLEVWRDPNLVVQPDGDVISREDIIATAGDDVVVRGAATEDLRAKGNPVFWSESGELMALPGGAVLVLDPSWDYSAIDAFFGRNGIDAGRLTELDFVTNGYFIETEPGFASLDLANSLAGQDGVELSSPNWWIERVTK